MMTITKTMMTRTPMMVPMIPLFMLLLLSDVWDWCLSGARGAPPFGANR